MNQSSQADFLDDLARSMVQSAHSATLKSVAEFLLKEGVKLRLQAESLRSDIR